MIKFYRCWHCKDEHGHPRRLKEEDLIKRVEEKGHIDYCCPNCESVIICCHKKIKKEV